MTPRIPFGNPLSGSLNERFDRFVVIDVDRGI
jgi:hypothetical protein